MYNYGAPLFQVKLARDSEPGQKLILRGSVLSEDCRIKVLPFLHTALTTQLYFKDDPNPAGDPWGGHKPSLALNLKQDGRYMVSDFDFVLGTGL